MKFRKYLIKGIRKDSKGGLEKIKTRLYELTPQEVAEKIKEGHTFVLLDGNNEVLVNVVKKGKKIYLKTSADNKSSNNLDTLPKF